MNVAADRELLFGLFALQNNLIDPGALVTAFQAWTRDKSKALAHHLVARGDLDAEQCAAIEAIVTLHIKKYGSVEKSLAAVSARNSTRESLGGIGDPDIDKTLSHVPGVQDSTVQGDFEQTASYNIGESTSSGQRFRILRPHARGGLGAVFVALDSELNREVALKQILDNHADDPDSRHRFLIEAEITGGLEHPGIVPVYGLGAYAGGRPFYAMRFIKGDSLKEAIDRFQNDGSMTSNPGRRSLELRNLLRRFTDVCNAIDYAHSRGVLHRDIKPGNVIVGKHGETLVVDWGLAKAIGHVDPGNEAGERALLPSSASGSADTVPGSALGTPAFMSPEQARGELDRLGPRSDVYSLGSTLYCLLTGKAPYEGNDVGEVLRKVQVGDLARPRQLDSTLDRALEAVCLKAMAHDPADRYASCRELAEDVDRWAADEPVTAWREPYPRRARRWMRRNQIAVTGAAVALVAGLLGLSAVLAVESRARAELSKSLARETGVNLALNIANDELTRSKGAVQSRYDLAIDAIKTFHTGVSEDFLLKEAQFKVLRDGLLKSAAAFYQKLGKLLGDETDLASRRGLAAARFEVADLSAQVGDLSAAIAMHEQVLAAREALAADPEADAETKGDVGRSLCAIAQNLRETGKDTESLAAWRRAEALLADLSRSSPGAARVQDALAFCRQRMGAQLAMMNKLAEALPMFRLARDYYEAAASTAGASIEARVGLGSIKGDMGVALADSGMLTEAEKEYRASLRVSQKLIDEFPTNERYRDDQARTHSNLGGLLVRTGRPKEGEREFRFSLALWEALSKDSPAVMMWANNLGYGRNGLGSLLMRDGRTKEAESEYRAALETFRRLSAENPENVACTFNQASGCSFVGATQMAQGRPAEAIKFFEREREIRRGIARTSPGFARNESYLAAAAARLSSALLADGRTNQARDEADQAITEFRALLKTDPQSDVDRGGLAATLLRAGHARRVCGDSTGAASQLREAIAMYEAMPPRDPRSTLLESCCHAQLASVIGRDGSDSSHADLEAATAIRLLQSAVRAGYHNPDEYRAERALDPLRRRPEFKILMSDLAMPTDPFAMSR